MSVIRKVCWFSGDVYAFGQQVVRYPKCRGPVLDGRGAARLEEPIREKVIERGWWERPWRKGGDQS